MSGGAGYPGSQALEDPDRPHGANSPAAGLPVRCGGLRGVSAAARVRLRVIREGTIGATAPAGGFVAAGLCPAAERGLCRVPSVEGGGGAPAGAAGAAGDSPSPLLRADQDKIPDVPGGHGRQPDTGGG